MNTETLVVIVIIVLALSVLIWQRTRTPKSSNFKSDLKPEIEYIRFLENMKTVFRGAVSKEQQEGFLTQNKNQIDEYLKYYPFEKEYKKIINQFGL